MRVLAFTKYDMLAASTRQRVLQYFPALEAAGISVDYFPLLDNDYVRSLVDRQPFSRRSIVKAYWKRLGQLLRCDRDVTWVYAELFPNLPAPLERLAFLSGTPVVYDFDDAFFISYDDNPSLIVRSLLAGKLEPLVSGAAAVCCGNDFLRSYALRYNDQCMVLPTVVDTSIYRPAIRRPADSSLTIGWIGSPSTWLNVVPLLPLLAAICREQGAKFRAIGAGTDAKADWFEGMDLIDWSFASEVEEIQAMDIGIMPLLDLPFQRGKSGYKLIQYMACGLPVVASPVGVNNEIVTDGFNGFIASNDDQWRNALLRLIDDPDLRARMGRAGRAKVEADYSLASQAPHLVELFRKVAAQGRR